MSRDVARILIRLGVILLILASLARLGGLTKANLIGDDLALLSSAGTILVGAAYLRFARRH
jgi:hypothetical protein